MNYKIEISKLESSKNLSLVDTSLQKQLIGGQKFYYDVTVTGNGKKPQGIITCDRSSGICTAQGSGFNVKPDPKRT
jgi:hypothetical protein